jgi:microcystin-dependent protein
LATDFDIVRSQSGRREYRWQPFDNPRSSSVEVPQGAYIGERRLFEVPPNDRWLLIDGAEYSRHRYRALFEEIGTTYGAGNGVTTFNVPLQADVSSDRGLVSFDTFPMTGGSDYTVTTSLATVPGLTSTFSVPAAAAYEMEVEVNLAVDSVYASGGLPDSEAVLRLNGSTVTLGGFSQSLEFRPTAEGRIAITEQWKVTFSVSGSNTVDVAISKADSTGTVTAVRKNSNMATKLYRRGGAVSGSGAWYICAG